MREKWCTDRCQRADKLQEEVKRAFMKMITSATKNIYIQTPYFVPDEPILESIKMAAQSGVDVRIMIPCMPDHVFVYWATYSYAAEIINSGGRIFIYDNGFLHAKTMTATARSAQWDQLILTEEVSSSIGKAMHSYMMRNLYTP